MIDLDSMPWRIILKVLAAATLGAVVTCILIVRSERTKETSNNVFITDTNSLVSVGADKAARPQAKVSLEQDRPSVTMATPNDLLRLRFERDEWRKSRGYFEQDDYLAYETYSDESIYQLAKSDDLMAVHLLANMHRRNGSSDDARSVLQHAVYLGSTRALTDLMFMVGLDSRDQNLTEQQQLSLTKQSLVFGEIAARRGDYSGILEGLIRLDQSGVVLTPKDIDDISITAKAAFDSINLQRSINGLHPLDNTPNELETASIQHLISGLRNRSEWGLDYILQ